MFRNTAQNWGIVARFFHWLTAALLGVQLSFGLYLSTLNLYDPGDLKTYVTIIATHKSIGLTIMLVILFRIAWRTVYGRPDMSPTLTPFEECVSRLSHWFLYALLVTLPVLGWAQSSAYRAETEFWGLFSLPHIVPDAYARPGSRAVWQFAQDAHSFLAVVLFVVILLHVAAALRHHFIKRDHVLARMLWGDNSASGSDRS